MSQDDIRDKIRKLFALAGSSNEHEAKRALAKAQELMLMHGIEDFKRGSEERAYERWISFGSRLPLQARMFYQLLSGEYRCSAYSAPGAILVVGGSEEDIDCCVQAVSFALESWERCWKEYWAQLDRKGSRNRQKTKMAYVYGFAKGIAQSNHNHRDECNLPAVVVPAIIEKHVNDNYRTRTTPDKLSSDRMESHALHAYRGYVAGKTSTMNKQIS